MAAVGLNFLDLTQDKSKIIVARDPTCYAEYLFECFRVVLAQDNRTKAVETMYASFNGLYFIYVIHFMSFQKEEVATEELFEHIFTVISFWTSHNTTVTSWMYLNELTKILDNQI